jgi:hypothetical protein
MLTSFDTAESRPGVCCNAESRFRQLEARFQRIGESRSEIVRGAAPRGASNYGLNERFDVIVPMAEAHIVPHKEWQDMNTR